MRMMPKKEKETDRLSALPEALVIHILCFLNTKHAVQASLSLKKWVNLWTLLPDLDFDSSVFKKLCSFDAFVHKVLTLRDDSVKINKFSFSRKRLTKPKLIERITEYAVSHDVQHFTIYVENAQNYSFKDQLGSSNSIKSFRLRGVSSLDKLCLGQLVTLHLESVRLTGTENFSGCPNLLNLSLSSCSFEYSSDGLNPARIVAPQLSMLIISGFAGWDRINGAPRLMLSTPRLTFFEISNSLFPSFQTDDLPLLETVDMDLYLNNADPQKLISMLKCFYNAKSIRISWSIVKLLSSSPDILAREPSPFCNLKFLNIVPFVRRTTFSFTIPGHVTTFFLRNSSDANTVVELPSYRKCSKW